MKQTAIRFLAAAAAAVMCTAALSACGASDSATNDSAAASVAAAKQSSIAAKMKENDAEAGTAVQDALGKIIDLSAYNAHNGSFTAKTQGGITLGKSVKFGDGNTFALGDVYKSMTDKGYHSDRDDEKLQPHSISINMETQNKKGEAVALTMRNGSGEVKAVQECPVVTLKFSYDAEKSASDFDYMGVTKDSTLADVADALGKSPDSMNKSEQKGIVTLNYGDHNNHLSVEIVYSVTDNRLLSFRISQA